jgi:hypothetical protein
MLSGRQVGPYCEGSWNNIRVDRLVQDPIEEDSWKSFQVDRLVQDPIQETLYREGFWKGYYRSICQIGWFRALKLDSLLIWDLIFSNQA